MDMDCIPSSPLKYVHAKIDNGGYISIDMRTFHRDMTIDEFPHTKMFNSLDEAIDELPNHDGEKFVMAFEENNICERLWFSEEQKEFGLLSRLNVFKTCYGEYKSAIWRKK